MAINKQSQTPIFENLLSRAKRKVISFHTPGHKNGKGIDRKLKQFTGKSAYFFDVTVFPEADSLHDPVDSGGVPAEASRAGAVWKFVSGCALQAGRLASILSRRPEPTEIGKI